MNRAAALLDDALVRVRPHEPGALDYEDLQIGDLLEQLVSETVAEADAKAQTIVIEGHARARADRRTLGSALSNLVRNAVKFTRRGGIIHLRVKASEARVTMEVEDSISQVPAPAHSSPGPDRPPARLLSRLKRIAAHRTRRGNFSRCTL